MDIKDLYDLIEAHLGNCKDYAPEKLGKMKRVKLPIPAEYGGGVVTGYGYDEAVKQLIERVKQHLNSTTEGPLFEECWEKWISLKEGQERSASTIGTYKWIAKTYLLPFFSGKHIIDITPDDIQEYYNSVMKYSKSVSTQSKAILSGIFDRAVRMRHIPQNIMLYGYERSKKQGEKVVLQDGDLIKVIEQIDSLFDTGDIRDYLYFCFLCFTALRRGEILGLRWKDLDFVGNQIYVRNNVTFPNGENDAVVCSPKDDSFGVNHMQTELKSRIEGYKQTGSHYVLPFSDEEPEKPMTRSMFNKMWRRISKRVDLKGATSHSFRASYATMMNAHCTHIDPKVLQGALRHKTPDLAIKVYTKKNDNKTRKAEIEYDEWLRSHLAN